MFLLERLLLLFFLSFLTFLLFGLLFFWLLRRFLLFLFLVLLFILFLFFFSLFLFFFILFLFFLLFSLLGLVLNLLLPLLIFIGYNALISNDGLGLLRLFFLAPLGLSDSLINLFLHIFKVFAEVAILCFLPFAYV
jgi:hypothetical protein